jgi:hypothetical protein
VYRNVESWCAGTAPPISGFLQMIMDCRICGDWKPRARAMAEGEWEEEEEEEEGCDIEAKGGESVCRLWPILLMERFLGLRSSPVGERASVRWG